MTTRRARAGCRGRGVPVVVAVFATCMGACARGIAPPPEPDGTGAFAHLEAQVAFGPRTPGSVASERCREYLFEQLAQYTAYVGAQSFTLRDPYGPDSLRLVNVLAHFYRERAKRVLLAAHYDSRPRADRDSGAARERAVPGANDGASGVAVLLDVARVLSAWDPGVGVDLVFFDGEDYGQESDHDYYLLGSRHFVQTMGTYRPYAMLLLDMVGDADLRIPMEEYSRTEAPRLTQLVFDVADSLQAPGFVREDGEAVFDDHVPFLARGIPAIDLIDFEYPAWHTTADLPERCAPGSLESVARVVLNTLHRLGRGAVL